MTLEKRKEILDKIAQRAKKFEPPVFNRYAQLQKLAEEAAPEVDEALTQLSTSLQELGEGISVLRENLGLDQPGDEGYGEKLNEFVHKEPEQLEGALNEVYGKLDGVIEDIENFADHLGITLEIEVDEDQVPEGAIPEEEIEETGPPAEED